MIHLFTGSSGYNNNRLNWLIVELPDCCIALTNETIIDNQNASHRMNIANGPGIHPMTK
ncbi:hypothetical protein [Pedobacter endophyticus]|uniref:Uncharacterized protein n=1 Tax=Pedobacter endophyticus TaxID=2789740 RepID=A0A7S9KYS8_9SPHI|nr:hypothetical protein [Pedobacter endophyticus]QPH39325.1 hypothetical protein IZT61_20140 [Pedobacter endophyticus]